MTDCVIVGGGIAGMTAAIYVARSGFKAVIIDDYNIGGSLNYIKEVSNYPGIINIDGRTFAQNLHQQCINYNVEFIDDKVVDINIDTKTVYTENKKAFIYKSLIIATGASPNRLLGERDLDFIDHGLSYCVHCDGFLASGKIAAVVGGGNTALSDALYLSEICKKVYLIHRRDEFRAEKILIDQVKSCDNIEFILNSTVKDLEVVDNDFSVDEEYLKIILNDGKSISNVSMIFVAIGTKANTDFVDLYKNADGTFKNFNTYVRDGVSVAGDCCEKVKQLAVASGSGCKAAINCIEYLNKIKNGNGNYS